MRAYLDDPAFENADHEPDVRVQNLAEGLGLLAAEARAGGIDEALHAEIALRAIGGFDRETLLEAGQTLAALGYTAIAPLLKRLARNAPRRLSWRERLAARVRESAASREQHQLH